MAELLTSNVTGNLIVTGNATSTNINVSNYTVVSGNIAFNRGGTLLANLPQITVGTTAHSSPRVGDLWVDTN